MSRLITSMIGAACAAILAAGLASAAPDEPTPAPVPPPGAATPNRPAPVPPRPDEIPPVPPDVPTSADAGLAPYNYTLDQAIQFFRQKVAAHPDDFHSFRYLGDLYDRKAKATGEIALFAEAERAFRAALKLFPDDPKTEAALAGVLCSRHAFVEGLAIARKILASDPGNIDALATLSDALIEIGRYPEGEEALHKLRKAAPVPEVLARLANLAELKGDADEATRLMAEAAAGVRRSKRPKADAWYVGILGDFALTAGKVDEAEALYKQVPEGVDPRHDATYGLARVAYARGDLPRAIDLAGQAVAIGPDAHMLAFLGDLLVEAGRSDAAKPYYDKVLQVTGDDSERRRALAKFLADHDRDLPRALELARKDFAERQDVFGADNLAWCLYKNGKLDEAGKAMDNALRLGTKDPNLLHHAGMIHLKRGDKARARDFLSRALAINPRFSVLGSAEAKSALAGLDAPAKP